MSITTKRREIANRICLLSICLLISLSQSCAFALSRGSENDANLENSLRTIADDYGNIVLWHYDDYDADGSKEAFFATGHEKNGEMGIDGIYFINNECDVKMVGSYPGLIYNKSGDCFRLCNNQGFFVGDMVANGSEWHTFVFSVKDGEPYELDVSMNIQGFYEENGTFYTLLNDFSQGYQRYLEYQLVFDVNYQQFYIGSMRVSNLIEAAVTTENNYQFTRMHKSRISAEVSSYYQDPDKFGARKLNDDDIDTAWVEGASDFGKGERITLYFDPQEIVGFEIQAGDFRHDFKYYWKNGRPKEIVVRVEGEDDIQVRLFETQENQYVIFNRPVYTGYIELELLSFYTDGTKGEDTCVTEVWVLKE